MTRSELEKLTVLWDTKKSRHRIKDLLSFGNILGKGSFARVYECYRKGSKKTRACKVILKETIKNDRMRKMVQGEILILSELKHENLIGLEEMLEDYKRVFLVTEYCGKNTLSKYVRSLGMKRLAAVDAKIIFR